MIWLLIIGFVLMGAGCLGTYLAMNSPVQLQPIPAIAFVVGVLMVVFSAGEVLT